MNYMISNNVQSCAITNNNEFPIICGVNNYTFYYSLPNNISNTMTSITLPNSYNNCCIGSQINNNIISASCYLYNSNYCGVVTITYDTNTKTGNYFYDGVITNSYNNMQVSCSDDGLSALIVYTDNNGNIIVNYSIRGKPYAQIDYITGTLNITKIAISKISNNPLNGVYSAMVNYTLNGTTYYSTFYKITYDTTSSNQSFSSLSEYTIPFDNIKTKPQYITTSNDFVLYYVNNDSKIYYYYDSTQLIYNINTGLFISFSSIDVNRQNTDNVFLTAADNTYKQCFFEINNLFSNASVITRKIKNNVKFSFIDLSQNNNFILLQGSSSTSNITSSNVYLLDNNKVLYTDLLSDVSISNNYVSGVNANTIYYSILSSNQFTSISSQPIFTNCCSNANMLYAYSSDYIAAYDLNNVTSTYSYLINQSVLKRVCCASGNFLLYVHSQTVPYITINAGVGNSNYKTIASINNSTFLNCAMSDSYNNKLSLIVHCLISGVKWFYVYIIDTTALTVTLTTYNLSGDLQPNEQYNDLQVINNNGTYLVAYLSGDYVCYVTYTTTISYILNVNCQTFNLYSLSTISLFYNGDYGCYITNNDVGVFYKINNLTTNFTRIVLASSTGITQASISYDGSKKIYIINGYLYYGDTIISTGMQASYAQLTDYPDGGYVFAQRGTTAYLYDYNDFNTNLGGVPLVGNFCIGRNNSGQLVLYTYSSSVIDKYIYGQTRIYRLENLVISSLDCSYDSFLVAYCGGDNINYTINGDTLFSKITTTGATFYDIKVTKNGVYSVIVAYYKMNSSNYAKIIILETSNVLSMFSTQLQTVPISTSLTYSDGNYCYYYLSGNDKNIYYLLFSDINVKSGYIVPLYNNSKFVIGCQNNYNNIFVVDGQYTYMILNVFNSPTVTTENIDNINTFQKVCSTVNGGNVSLLSGQQCITINKVF